MAADIKRHSQVIMIIAYDLDMKDVSTHPLFQFSAVDYLPPPQPPCLSIPLIYNVYYDNTDIHAKWLVEAQGGGGEYL